LEAARSRRWCDRPRAVDSHPPEGIWSIGEQVSPPGAFPITNQAEAAGSQHIDYRATVVCAESLDLPRASEYGKRCRLVVTSWRRTRRGAPRLSSR
jgi:hypothetical protein